MNFTWTTLHISNMETSLSFYQDIIGLPLKRRFSPDGVMEIAFLGNEGESEIELIYELNNEQVNNKGISVGFMSQNPIEETLKFLESKGYKAVTPIFSPNPKIKFFYINDPDGHRVQLIQNIN